MLVLKCFAGVRFTLGRDIAMFSLHGHRPLSPLRAHLRGAQHAPPAHLNPRKTRQTREIFSPMAKRNMLRGPISMLRRKGALRAVPRIYMQQNNTATPTRIPRTLGLWAAVGIGRLHALGFINSFTLGTEEIDPRFMT